MWCVYCVSSLILIILITFLAFGALIFDPFPTQTSHVKNGVPE